jgi:hypothetical protein
MTDTAKRRGRPPLAWVGPDGLKAMPAGIPVMVEMAGDHAPRTIGRIRSHSDALTVLVDRAGELLELDRLRVKRARTIRELYAPGDPVLKRGVPVAAWRGGVVRTDGTQILVEQIDGTFTWLDEIEIEPAEARDQPPKLPRGPVPARVV